MWKNHSWRQAPPSERAQISGMPPAAVEAIPGPPDQQQQHNSLLGNGLHLPSLLAVLCLLPAFLEAKIAPTPCSPDLELRARLEGTIWEPGRLEKFPDTVSGQ